jgi:DNA-binding CsgD family transcriptional regulator
VLVGRGRERALVEQVLADARAAHSRALVVRGEAGIGKTVLLDQAAADAADMRVIRGVGIESEAEVPFSGLHLLLYPFIDRLGALPGQQAAALRSAFGLADAPVHDRFLIGAATLTLLSELAGDKPLLCLVDDAQWLDQASSEALFFAARRLHADPIAMIFAVRETAQPFTAPGIEVLRLDGLERAYAERLLDEHAPDLTVPVRQRLLDEATGNPLAIIELARALRTETGLAHQIGPLRVTGRIQETFRAQIAEMPPATRLVLLVAAADSTADVGVVLRAADSLGVQPVDLGPAEEARLVVLSGDEIRFRHPLIRAVAYQSATHHQRISVHDALARTLVGDDQADRRTWHLAAATTGPDEKVAEELEQAARRAQHRGGAVAVAAAYERAARLSTEQAGKARRMVNAARAAYDAGQPDWATRLAVEAASLTGEPAVAAEAAYIRAQVEYERTSPAADAELALEGAALIAPHDPERAVSMLTESTWAARDAGAHDLVRRSVEQLEALRLPPGSPTAPVAAALIGYGRLADGAAGAAMAPMRSLVAAAKAGSVADFVERLIAGFMGLLVADDEAATEVLESVAAEARERGALGWLPYAMEGLALGRLLRGDFRGAEASVAEGLSLAADIGMDMQVIALKGISAWLAAVAGDAPRCRSLTEDVLAHAEVHPTNAALASWGWGLLALAEGHSAEAVERLDAVCTGPARHDVLIRAVPDHVEAAVRSGRPELARRHLPAFQTWAEHTGDVLAAALLSRCRALLSPGGSAADEHYSAALRHSRGGDRSYDAARTHLVYGEWLRRQRRRSDARAHLDQAHDAFARLGAATWAERARAELEALGDRPVARVHDADLLNRLTPQELQVVRLAAAGYSNREIGAQLYLSPRTVGHHLYKAFPKIGVSRRMELSRLEL